MNLNAAKTAVSEVKERVGNYVQAKYGKCQKMRKRIRVWRANRLSVKAALQGDFSSLEKHIFNDADPNYVSPRYGNTTALVAAAERSNFEAVRFLVWWNADVNKPRNPEFDGLTPLMAAASSGYPKVKDVVKIVEVLVREGADIDAKDIEGMTALMFAAKCGHPEVVKKLIELGANKSLKNNDNKTALDLAEERNFYNADSVNTLKIFPDRNQSVTGNASITDLQQMG